MNTLRNTFFISLIMVVCSCTSTKSAIAYPITFSKEACKGKCPIYNVEILKSGEVQFEGIANTKYIGKKKIQLSKEEFRVLKKAYKQINFSKLDKIYDQRIYDFPVTSIKDKTNSVSFKRNQSIPNELKSFIKLLDNMLKYRHLI